MEKLTRIVPVLLASSGLALAACSRSHEPTASTSTANTKDVATPDSSSSGTPAATNTADADQQASLAAREQDLNAREAALKQQQQDVQDEIARRDAMIAAEKSRSTHATSTKSTTASNASSGSSSSKSDSPSVLSHQPEPSATLASTSGNSSLGTGSSAAPMGQSRFTVPAGTPLQIELTAGVNTKKAHVGDTVTGRLHSPIMVGDTNAVEAGSAVTGTVTQVVSGGNQIGGVPTLGLTFDTLVAEDGSHVPISAQFVQQGTSETVKDTAKIVGGAAAGAVVGHQVNNSNKGTIIGGILGGAAGAAAAKNTGGEVKLPSGTVLSVTTESSFQVER